MVGDQGAAADGAHDDRRSYHFNAGTWILKRKKEKYIESKNT